MSPDRSSQVSGRIYILLLLILTFGASCSPNWRDPATVADRFAIALMENDVDLAKELVYPSQWHLIDDWIANHKAFSCPGRDYDSGTSVVGGKLTDSDLWDVSVLYQCVEAGSYHCFSLTNILLQPENGRYRVKSWEFNCERYDLCDACR
jgi:hypothetical protein